MSFRNTVTFRTLSMDDPEASMTLLRFSSACLACAAAPSGILPVDGSTGICPETYTVPFCTTAWE
jgi:hypothetical protein